MLMVKANKDIVRQIRKARAITEKLEWERNQRIRIELRRIAHWKASNALKEKSA